MTPLFERVRIEQGGFTLMELVVAMTIGMLVMFAAITLMDSGARSTARTIDRADTTQRGRTAMTAIQRRLRSQLCLDDETPPIVTAGNDSVTYYTDVDPDPYFVPQRHTITYDGTAKGGRGSISETVEAPPATNTSPPWSFTESRTNLLVDDVTLQPGKPFLTYSSWRAPTTPLTGADLPLSPVTSGDSVPLNSVATVVRIGVAYRVRPKKTDDTPGLTSVQNDANRSADFESTVYVRNTDYSDTEASNRVWGPRCS